MNGNVVIKLKIRFYEILEMDHMASDDIDELFLIKSILENRELLNPEVVKKLQIIRWERGKE